MHRNFTTDSSLSLFESFLSHYSSFALSGDSVHIGIENSRSSIITPLRKFQEGLSINVKGDSVYGKQRSYRRSIESLVCVGENLDSIAAEILMTRVFFLY